MMCKITYTIAFVGTAVAALGCDYFGPTGVRIGVEHEPGGYIFHFTSCRGAPIGVHGIRIAKVDVQRSGVGEPFNHDARYCEVGLRASQSIRGSWRYGTLPPSGVLTAEYRALTPGNYLADVSGGEAGGYRDFRIEGDGSVKLEKVLVISEGRTGVGGRVYLALREDPTVVDLIVP